MNKIHISSKLEGSLAANANEFALYSTDSERMICIGQNFDISPFERTANPAGAYSTIRFTPAETIIEADASGQYPVYWRQQGDDIMIDQSPLGLGPAEIDPVYMAAGVLAIEHVLPGTVFDGVHVVENGQKIRFTSDNRIIESPGLSAPSFDKTYAGAVESLQAALVEAVERRMQGGRDGIVTADFSGGLDSTSVALLAASYSSVPLDVFIQYHPGSAAGDLRFARDFAGLPGVNVRLHELQTTTRELPFAGMAKVLYSDMPHFSESVGADISHRFAAAAQHGSALHLTGEGGDAVFGIPPQVIIDIARWQPERLDDEIFTRASIYNTDPNALLAYAQLNIDVTFSDNLVNIAAFLRNPATRPASPWISLPPRRVVEWFSQDIRDELAARIETLAYRYDMPAEMGVADYIARTGVHSSGFVQRYLRKAGYKAGTAVHAPLLDGQVVSACLDTPACVRSDPRRFKKILGDAFNYVLPASLVRRSSKGAYDGEFYRGLRRARNPIDTLLAGSRLAALGVLRSTAVAAEIARLHTGADGARPNVVRAIVAEQWLHSRELL